MSELLKANSIIDELKQLKEKANIPLTNKFMVDKDVFDKLLEKLTAALPDDVINAKNVLEQRDSMLEESRLQAQSMIDNANATATKTITDANEQAQNTLTDAQNRSEAMLQDSSNRANATIADAQQQATAILNDAHQQAAALVSESEIMACAQRDAQALMEQTQQQADELTQGVRNTLNGALEQADLSLVSQLNALRELRQKMSVQ